LFRSKRLGIGTILLIGVLFWFFGGDVGNLLGGLVGVETPSPVTSTGPQAPLRQSQAEQELAEFVSVVLADTEDTWSRLFSEAGKRYREPKLVLFRGATRSACGIGQADMGPFYCPADQKVYLDLGFFDDLQARYNAPGDFAQAYVVAHEIGHHVQNLLGITAAVSEAQRSVGDRQANRYSVRQELQADCFAGVWAHHADRSRHILERGDIEEGLNAASAVGDDRMQRRSYGYVSPDSFTHGSSEQRMRWFNTGLQWGELKRCDTFSVRDP
jgi:predicted metalloprotease